MMSSIIIGIDPGSTDHKGGGSGIAWLAEDEEGCFTLRRAPHEGLGSFLVRLRDEVEGLLGRDGHGCMVVYERPFVHPKMPGAALGLMRIAGVIEEIGARQGATVVAVPPPVLRSANAVTAKGKAGKAEMINAMKACGHSPATEHEADAWACVEYALRHTVAAA